MKESWNKPFEHFFLSERNQEEVAQSLARMIGDVIFFAKPDVVAYAQNTPPNKITGGSQDDKKGDLLC
jgi:hypothetical protein